MANSMIKVGKAEAHYNVSGTKILKYTVEMYHDGLHEHKLISAPDLDILQNKANMQANKWNDKWIRIDEKQKNLDSREKNIEEAFLRTEEAINEQKILENLLNYTLSIDDKVDWDDLKRKDKFSKGKPIEPIWGILKEIPHKPRKMASEFVPTFTLFEKLFKKKKNQKIQECEKKYQNAVNDWEVEKKSIIEYNGKIEKQYQLDLLLWKDDVAKWEKEKENFLKKQDEYNIKIDNFKVEYFEKNQESILQYCEIVLNNSNYPDYFPKNFELEYNPDNKILIIDYELPSIEKIPKVKEVKYVLSRRELKEIFLPEAQINKIYDDVLYKFSLRTIHELFEADVINALDAISFNGWVNSINKATGNEENNYILSIQVTKLVFERIDLSNIDPKTCFKNLKGVSSSKLSSLTPIRPILQINKSDKRFVDGYDVVDSLEEETNLAVMNWEDFEHLIRELFEKEFQSSGGEVKVTRASRDGGVDAIAFDPDPIRGGKIVIQAKRYTNTVGVASVRDLYGTVVNEGATKGILVSTSDYGPDAYEFAKDKPLTLLSGSNLLHLLQKHGHRAKIDLREAKIILANQKIQL